MPPVGAGRHPRGRSRPSGGAVATGVVGDGGCCLAPRTPFADPCGASPSSRVLGTSTGVTAPCRPRAPPRPVAPAAADSPLGATARVWVAVCLSLAVSTAETPELAVAHAGAGQGPVPSPTDATMTWKLSAAPTSGQGPGAGVTAALTGTISTHRRHRWSDGRWRGAAAITGEEPDPSQLSPRRSVTAPERRPRTSSRWLPPRCGVWRRSRPARRTPSLVTAPPPASFSHDTQPRLLESSLPLQPRTGRGSLSTRAPEAWPQPPARLHRGSPRPGG